MRSEVKAKGHGKKDPYNVLYDAMVSASSNLLHFGVIAGADCIEVRIKQRGEGDWLAIAKRYGDDGAVEVIFGTGYDFLSCVLGLNAAMAGNRWRADTPWKGNGQT